MDLDKLTIGEARELARLFGGSGSTEIPKIPHLEVGKSVFIRSVTHHYTGRVVALTSHAVQLEDAAWIADDGRFNEALRTGKLNEVEPYPHGCTVLLGCILDVSPYPHALQREVV